jgi:hypothetical protein
MSQTGPWSTGVGSLPFTELEAARRVAFACDRPFLPELPGLDPDDGLIRRPFAGLLAPGDLLEANLRAPLETALVAPVVLGPGAAIPGLLKVQLAGPCVLGSYVRDARGRPLGASPEGRALALARVEALARALLARSPGAIVFLDEPGLASNVEDLARAVERVRAAGAARVGVHDCGPDFRRALAAKPDLLAFDFASFGESVGRGSDALAPFVRAGGALSWGVVSTLPGGTRHFDAGRVAGSVREAARKLVGDEAGALLGRSLVTPACGTALLPPDEAVLAHEHAGAVARWLRG